MAKSNKQQKNTKKATKFSFGKLAAISLSVVAVVVAVVLITTHLGKNKGPVDSDLIIPISEISAQAKFYPVKVDGTQLEVLAVKAPDGSIRTAFNTCQVCYSSGRGYYVQDGDVLVCQNCGNRFGMADVEVTRGGCNPVPITPEDKTVTDTSIVISRDFLSKAKNIFANWKR